jgi:hypothetical protein
MRRSTPAITERDVRPSVRKKAPDSRGLLCAFEFRHSPVCPDERPPREINPKRVARRVAANRSGDRIAGARPLNRRTKTCHMPHDWSGVRNVHFRVVTASECRAMLSIG